LTCESNGIRWYYIDLAQKHCEVHCLSSNMIDVNDPNSKRACYLKFDVPDDCEMLADIGGYTITVRIISKRPSIQMQQILRKGKSDTFEAVGVFQD